MEQLPDASAYLVASKSGQIWTISNDMTTSSTQLFLDITSQIDIGEDAGVMNFALHPKFGTASATDSAYIYVWYNYHPTPATATACFDHALLRLSRFTVSGNPLAANPASEQILIQQYDRHCIHMGGGLFFGTDSFLYLSIGDEGGGYDYFDVTQKIDGKLFGGLLRIDVDKDPTKSHPIRRQPNDPSDKDPSLPGSFTQGYYIPNDNPWQDPMGSILEEFYAIGLRSPHRATYDAIDNKIWVGDVGQASLEEIDIIEKGGNYQWPYMEGTAIGNKPMPTTLIGTEHPPVYDYPRSDGTCIIGGFVYRGAKWPSLFGKYIFGDHGTRNIWTLDPVTNQVELLLTVPAFGMGPKAGISSFATDASGEIYVLKLYAFNTDGAVIFKLHRGNPVAEPPALLSQTGLFSNTATLTPAPSLLPYTVNAPLWSDRAEKKRWVAIPNDGTHDTAAEQIVFNATSEWTFPEGTIFVKHFELPLDENNLNTTTRLETRVLVIGTNGNAYGLTYKWNTAQTDADLLTTSSTETFNITAAGGGTYTQTWEYPSRTACMTCHNANAKYVLGPKTWQLNGDYAYPSGVTDNQLNTWNSLGIFDTNLSASDIASYLQSTHINDGSSSLEKRVRSYIDANCAHCHRPNGVEGVFDARFSTPLAQQKLICEFGLSRNTPAGSFVVQPDEVTNSHLFLRDNSLSADKMPPIAKSIIDQDYIQVLSDWIDGLNRIEISINTKVFLQGCYDANTGKMTDDLRLAGFIPNQDPYLGTHQIVSPMILGNYGDNSIVDWVLLELRDQTDVSKVMAKIPALLQRDGDVVQADGVSPVIFECIEDGNYYVAVRHRNHLGIMTNSPVFID